MGSSETRDSLHGGNHHCGTCHIALHVFHRCAWLETEPSGVESDPLPDEGDGRSLVGPSVLQNHERRGILGPGRHAQEAAEPCLANPGLIPDLNVDAGLDGDASNSFGQLSGSFVRGRRVHQVAREIDRLAHDLSPSHLLLDLSQAILRLVGSHDKAQNAELVPAWLRLAQARATRSRNDSLNQRAEPFRRVGINALGNQHGHVISSLAGKTFGQGEDPRRTPSPR